MFTRRYLEEQLYTTLAGQHLVLLTSIYHTSAVDFLNILSASPTLEESCRFMSSEKLPSMSRAGVWLPDEQTLLQIWRAGSRQVRCCGLQGGLGRR